MEREKDQWDLWPRLGRAEYRFDKRVDPRLVKLARTMADFPAIRIGQGVVYEDEEWHAGGGYDFSLWFEIAHDENGWFTVEFLTWLINSEIKNQLQSGERV